jgi:hypothetical protein
MNHFITFLPLIVILLNIGLACIAIILYRKYEKSLRRRSPFKDQFLRSPGQSLIGQIEAINQEIQLYFIYLLLGPLSILSVHLAQLYSKNISSSWLRWAIIIVLIIGICTFYLYKLWKLLPKRRSLRLGLEGEMATGQELNLLMLQGYRVFHDFPADKFNIDHIVIGPAGVFAVETKARFKPTSENPTADAKVFYDGKSLRFPTHTSQSALKQAGRQAQWFATWLSRAIGEKVPVQAVLTLPGWYVERTAGSGIKVINPKEMGKMLKIPKEGALPESLVQRISHQVEQKCRDVAPRAYADDEMTFPRNCGQSGKLLRRRQEDCHGIEAQDLHPRVQSRDGQVLDRR